MKIIADMHTHTIASYHAYSTILENIQAAGRAHHSAIAITEHGPNMKDAPLLNYFKNLRIIPKTVDGVRVFCGVELNILDAEGNVDLADDYLARLDFAIASFHKEVTAPLSEQEHTNAYIALAANPFIDMLGHTGNPNFPYSFEPVIQKMKQHSKAMEINENSSVARPNSEENCKTILRLCKQYEVPVFVNSDAHFCTMIGNYSRSLSMLSELSFPEELVINADEERLNNYVRRRKEEKLAFFQKTL